MKLVAAAIIFNNNARKILLARRKKGEILEGYWEFPGGKIEKGETPQQCIERELFEELGIYAKGKKIIGESIYIYKEGTIKLIGVITEIKNQSFELKVHDKVQWVSVSEILSYKLAPADISIAKQIMGFNKHV